MPNSGDGALLELSTRNLFTRGILLGPYSRFHFFHPGPFYFFLRFPLYILSGCRNSSFLITTSLIALGSMYGAWHILRKRLGNTAALLFSVCSAFFLLHMSKTIWLSEWNPFVIIFPVLLFCISAAAFAGRFRGAFLLMVLSGSFVAQTHLGGIPSLASVFLIGLICFVYQWVIRTDQRNSPLVKWKQYLPGILLLFVLWLPPLYEQVSAEGKGNMTKIQEFFEDGKPDATHSEAFSEWSRSISAFELGSLPEQMNRNDSSGTLALVTVALKLLFLSMGYSLLRKRGDQSFMSSLNLICIGLYGASWYSVLQIRGDLNPYLVTWMEVIAPVSLFTILYSFLLVFREKFSRVKIKPVFISLGLLAALMVVTFLNVQDVRGYFRMELDPSWEEEIAVRELSEQLAGELVIDGNDFYTLNLYSPETWPVLFGLMNQLEKQGYPVGVQDNFMFVPTPLPKGINPRNLYIGILNEQQTEIPGLVASCNGIGLILE